MKRLLEEETDLLSRGRRRIFGDTKFWRLSNCDLGRIIREEDPGEFSFEKIPFPVSKDLKFLRGLSMAVLKIRISDDEAAWLEALARTQGTTKTRSFDPL